MKKISILLKPTDECNFRCKYCYHADSNYEKGRMSIELFEEIIRKSFSDFTHIKLIFHGGEPLLMGHDWFEKTFDIMRRYRNDNQNLKISLQTNGYFLDQKFCDLFLENDVSIGISFDGPGKLNSLRDKTDEVTEKIISLRTKGYKIGLLGVVTKRNLHGLKIFYEFAKENGCDLKLNPVFKSGAAKEEFDYLISAKEFVGELKELLPIWLKDENMAVEPLINLTAMTLIGRGISCATCGCLSRWVALNHDGTVFPCSRSYPKEYTLGNIKDVDHLSSVFDHENFTELLKGAIERRSYCQKTCSYYPVCQGGCNNDAILNGNITRPSGFMCEVYREMIPFIKNCIDNCLSEIKNQYVLKLTAKSKLMEK